MYLLIDSRLDSTRRAGMLSCQVCYLGGVVEDLARVVQTTSKRKCIALCNGQILGLSLLTFARHYAWFIHVLLRVVAALITIRCGSVIGFAFHA